MKQITLSNEWYEVLMNKIHENTYGYGKTPLENYILDNTVEIEGPTEEELDQGRCVIGLMKSFMDSERS